MHDDVLENASRFQMIRSGFHAAKLPKTNHPHVGSTKNHFEGLVLCMEEGDR